MKYIVIILAVFIFSCNEKQKANSGAIAKFEEILGETESEFLNEIVRDFEIYLKSEFVDSEIDFLYKNYLRQLSENSLKNTWVIDSAKLKKYKNDSKLFYKFSKIYPDTVWYENDEYNLTFKKLELTESIIPLKHLNEHLKIDSMINHLKNEPKLIVLEESRFYIALDSIKNENSFIAEFLESREAGGPISDRQLAVGLLNANPDYSDYFIRRIIAFETLE